MRKAAPSESQDLLDATNTKRSPQAQSKNPPENSSLNVRASRTTVPFSSGIVGLNCFLFSFSGSFPLPFFLDPTSI
jgi:hypothetical protein